MGNGFCAFLEMRMGKSGAIAQKAAHEAPLIHRLFGAVVCAWLDPYFGIMHGSGRDHGSLVFDVIEEYRAPFADRVVVAHVSLEDLYAKQPWGAGNEMHPRCVHHVAPARTGRG